LVKTGLVGGAANTSFTQSACGSYVWNGVTYTTSGTYTYAYTNAGGCVSVDTLRLTITSPATSTTNTSICPSALPYTWNGLTFNIAGSQTAHITNAGGCDSAATLNLFVKANTSSINYHFSFTTTL
jgi:trimeric autotransporter adhesin